MGKQYASVCETRRDSPKRPGIFDAGAFSILSFSRGCDFSVESSPANCYFRRLTKHSFRGCSFSGGFLCGGASVVFWRGLAGSQS